MKPLKLALFRVNMPSLRDPAPQHKPANMRLSPLIPPKEGYPIPLNQGKNPIRVEDLESEPRMIVINTSQGAQNRYIDLKNPYLMKGATEIIKRQNEPLQAENDKIAEELVKRSREDEKNWIDTFNDNESRASNPAGNPTFIVRTTGQGPDKTFK